MATTRQTSLQDRAAFVTGAGSGIARAAAMLMARHGAKVACVGRTRDELEAAAAEIAADAEVRAAGGEAVALVADIAKPDQMEAAYRDAVARFGRLDVVFANAGVNGVWCPIEEMTPEEWEKTISINLTGTFLTLKYAIPHLKKEANGRGGSVVITSSVNGTRIFSNPGASAYSSTKAAQVALAKMAALELAKHRIRVNVICPGAIETNIDDNTQKRHTDRAAEPAEFPEGKIPLTDGRPGTGEQVADLVLFLASDASAHISGTEVWIDGAESLLQG